MKSVVRWYDLPSHTVVKIDQEYQKRLYEILKTKFQKRKVVAEKLGMTTLQVMLYDRLASNFSVKSLRKVANLTDTDVDDVESHIIEIGRKRTRIFKPNLPFNVSSPEGVALISIVNSEGHIPKQKGTSMHIRVNEVDMLEKAISYAKCVFGDFAVEIKQTKGKNTSEIFFPSVITDSLEIAGLIRGSKSKKNPGVPQYVLESDEFCRIYIGWSFACEMEANSFVVKLTRDIDVSDVVPEDYVMACAPGVIFKKKIPPFIYDIVSRKKCNLIEDEAKMLNRFGINKIPTVTNFWKTKDGRLTAAWKIIISDKETIKKLISIGIPLKEKEEKLKSIIASYKRENILNMDTYRRTYEKAHSIQLTKSFFHRKDIVNRSVKYDDRRIDSQLKRFQEKGIVIKLGYGKYKII